MYRLLLREAEGKAVLLPPSPPPFVVPCDCAFILSACPLFLFRGIRLTQSPLARTGTKRAKFDREGLGNWWPGTFLMTSLKRAPQNRSNMLFFSVFFQVFLDYIVLLERFREIVQVRLQAGIPRASKQKCPVTAHSGNKFLTSLLTNAGNVD